MDSPRIQMSFLDFCFSSNWERERERERERESGI